MHRNGNGHAKRNPHLIRALAALERGKFEWAAAKKSKDELSAAQAAEKVWLSVAEATHAFLRHKGVGERNLPKGSNGAFAQLRRHGGHDLVKTFLETRGILHTETFYRGAVDWPSIDEVIADADRFVSRVKFLATRN
jgi:hypothetical protein